MLYSFIHSFLSSFIWVRHSYTHTILVDRHRQVEIFVYFFVVDTGYIVTTDFIVYIRNFVSLKSTPKCVDIKLLLEFWSVKSINTINRKVFISSECTTQRNHLRHDPHIPSIRMYQHGMHIILMLPRFSWNFNCFLIVEFFILSGV